MLASYQDVPYHNCLHGADVLQAMHALLNLAPTFDDALDDDVVLVTLLACLSHDVGHPGLTNNFLVETGHELAMPRSVAAAVEASPLPAPAAPATPLAEKTRCGLAPPPHPPSRHPCVGGAPGTCTSLPRLQRKERGLHRRSRMMPFTALRNLPFADGPSTL